MYSLREVRWYKKRYGSFRYNAILFISFEYISVRYPVLIIEIQCGKFNREHGLIVVKFDCFGVCDGFFQNRTFAETTQIAVGNFKVNNTCIVVRMQCFQFVGRECQDSLPGTNPQISIQGTEGTTLFQFYVQETVVFVVVTKLFGSLIEARQANFRCKPQVAVLSSTMDLTTSLFIPSRMPYDLKIGSRFSLS